MARQRAAVQLRGDAAHGYTYDFSDGLHAESALLASAGPGAGVDLEFGAGGGTRRLELRLPGLPGADVELAGAALRIVPLAHEVTRALPAADTTALDVDFPADVAVTGLRLVGLALPGQGGTFHRFSRGGVTVRTPLPDDDDDDGTAPAYTDVRAVLAAGPAGGSPGGHLGPPAVGFNGFGPPGALYGDQLPSGTVSGSASSVLLRPPRPLRAGTLRLTFCTDDGGPTTLSPVPFSVAAAQVTRAAHPSGMTIDVGGVRAWEHAPELATSVDAPLAPILSALLPPALRAAEGTPVSIPIAVSCASPARVRVEIAGAALTLVRRAFERSPAAISLTGAAAAVTVPPLRGPAPAEARSRLTGAFGAVRRTAASPAGFAPPSVSGQVATAGTFLARLVVPAALEGRPLVRLGLLGASTDGELVVEVRADAAGPGAPLLPPGILPLETNGRPRWIGVDIEPLTAQAIPPSGLWLVVRTNRGRFLWADGAALGILDVPGETRRSDDAGSTWRRVEAAPALQLFVEDPGGGAAVVAVVGAQRAPLLASTGEAAFDVVVTWPAALRAALSGEDPLRVELDCARDVQLEIADLQLRDARTLTLHEPPS